MGCFDDSMIVEHLSSKASYPFGLTIELAETATAGGLFNVGSGQAHTWIELATAIFEALGHPPKIEFIEMPESLRGKYQYYTQADLTKLRGYCKTMKRVWRN